MIREGHDVLVHAVLMLEVHESIRMSFGEKFE